MRIQSQEELSHAMKLFDYVTDRGGRVALKAIAQPPVEYKSALDIFKKALEHEQFVTASIHKLYALSVKENDYASQILLQWFVTEQVEEEKNATLIVEQLKIVGDSKTSLMLLDRHLAKRGA
jgi:ferritin